MYARTYEYVQPNTHSYASQNVHGAWQYTHGYNQPRYANYSTPIVQMPGLRCPPPPLTHLTEQQSQNYRGHVHERPSCMLQETWRPNLSCLRNECEENSEENDADSLEDGAEGNITAAIELGFMHVIPIPGTTFSETTTAAYYNFCVFFWNKAQRILGCLSKVLKPNNSPSCMRVERLTRREHYVGGNISTCKITILHRFISENKLLNCHFDRSSWLVSKQIYAFANRITSHDSLLSFSTKFLRPVCPSRAQNKPVLVIL